MTTSVRDPRATLKEIAPLLEKAGRSAKGRDLRPDDLAANAVVGARKAIRTWATSRRGVERSAVPDLRDQVGQARSAARDLLDRHHPSGALRAALEGLYRTLSELETRLSTAARLYEFRRANGLSLQDLAGRLDLTQPYLGLLEKAAVGLPRYEKMQAVAEMIKQIPPSPGTQRDDAADAAREVALEDRYEALALLKKRMAKLPPADIRFLADVAALLAKRQSG
jgi:transcriptional regulator with XRE-family HTH domain